MTALALTLAAVAVLASPTLIPRSFVRATAVPGSAVTRLRRVGGSVSSGPGNGSIRDSAPGTGLGAIGAVVAGVRSRWRGGARRGIPATDAELPLTALTADLFSACLAAGLPVPTALRAVTGVTSGRAAEVLRRSADALALGAPAEQAFQPARRHSGTAELARAACRTARSGSAMASAASAVGARAREASADEGEARAERAGVLIVGPLALCFLPAFLCLGVIPVVVGFAARLGLPT